ncbi:hypothetical protein FRC04_000726 [Tulasnella sp. 424]|nr:hypothetical protein FRC04_000726 [Tulasnella sp. 424]KAG8968584.1 hypothetical protein FRC05_001509 [Tulasnella sp. 425]
MDYIKGQAWSMKNRAPSYVAALFREDEEESKTALNSRPFTLQALNAPVQRPRPKKWLPIYLRQWFVWFFLFSTFGVAGLVEVALVLSERRKGWRTLGIESFGGANFLKSAVPVILTTPIGFIFGKMDQALAGMHAYVVLSKGRAPADKSLLLNYTGGRFTTMRQSLFNAHFLVFFSSVIVLTTGVLSPLASGILTSRGSPVLVPDVSVQSTKSLGLISDIASLETFLAAAGYAAAAASAGNLTDPPFIHGTWSVAQFNVPPPTGPGTNGTVIVPTTGIQTMANCGAAASQSATLANGQWSIQAAWESCTVTMTAATQGDQDLFGVEPVPTCTQNQQQNPSFQPVLFWFLSGQTQGLSLTFCQPTSRAYNVLAVADLATGLLGDVVVVDDNVAQNNFTGPPFNGQALNGVYFSQTSDRFVNARALAVQTALPDSIYRATRSFAGGLAGIIAQNNGAELTALTNKTYTQFLSFAAQQSYFFDNLSTIDSSIQNWELRLWVYPIAAHSYAAALVLIGLLAAWVHLMHLRARRDVHLSCDPSTMAATLSMTSESGFPRLLKAGDDDAAMARSLKGLTFGISRRTWQVVAEGEEEGTLGFVTGRGGVGPSRDVRLGSLASSVGTPGSTQTVFDAGDQQGLLSGAAPYGRRESNVDPFTIPPSR